MSNLDDSYFDSYGDISIHELMLNDKIRTNAYENFIDNFKHLFFDKIILDVGSGTAILSLFAARAGAKMVYAVEANEIISKMSLQIIKNNGYSEKITVINDKVENIDIEKVDIIISEWMGFYLLHESMIDSVIYARDRFLKFDGIIIPALAHIYVCPTSIDSFYKSNLQNWKSFHGFDFSSFGEDLSFSNGGIKIMSIKETDLIDDPKIIASFDLKYVHTSDLNRIISSLEFKANKYSVLRGYAFWFCVNFIDNSDEDYVDTTKNIEDTPTDNLNQANNQVYISTNNKDDISKNKEKADIPFNCLDTSPLSPDTHWFQTVVILPESFLVSENQNMACTIEIIREMHWLNLADKSSIDVSTNKDEIYNNEILIVNKTNISKDANIAQNNITNASKINPILCENKSKYRSTDLEISRQYRIIVQIPDDDEDIDMVDDGYNDICNENSDEVDAYDSDIRTEIIKCIK